MQDATNRTQRVNTVNGENENGAKYPARGLGGSGRKTSEEARKAASMKRTRDNHENGNPTRQEIMKMMTKRGKKEREREKKKKK